MAYSLHTKAIHMGHQSSTADSKRGQCTMETQEARDLLRKSVTFLTDGKIIKRCGRQSQSIQVLMSPFLGVSAPVSGQLQVIILIKFATDGELARAQMPSNVHTNFFCYLSNTFVAMYWER